MRVYLNIPSGVAMCGGKRVYGYAQAYEPTTITHKEWTGNRGTLVEAPYTPEYLTRIFGKEFPCNVRFTLSELFYMDYRLLQKIGTYLDCDSLAARKPLAYRIRFKLRDI